MKKDEQIVEIKFFDFEISHQSISKTLDIEPTGFWKKGETYTVGPIGKEKALIRNNSYWGFGVSRITNNSIGELIKEFIETIVTPRINEIKSISDKCHAEFGVVQYVYEGVNPGLHLNKNQIEILNKCGLSLDIDFYVLQEE
ncbi:MAG: DUF4279 domain-containing protein [Cyclobacteriaceae bacterium]|nr:DUF4279 domain-containing protein [Mangrovimonas sp.]MCB0494982.1 DUF4279 domain-containing protein [Cyclobacteriaceae bacterium]